MAVSRVHAVFVILCFGIWFASGYMTRAEMGSSPAKPTLRSFFTPDNPNWHGASLSGGIVCWTLLDASSSGPYWSADYCSR